MSSLYPLAAVIDPGGADSFTFDGRTGRPSGPVLRTLAAMLPGVAQVQRQIEPYAAAWRESNLVALGGTGVRWVALGDSMTQGIGASSPWAGWVPQLAQRLPVAVDVVNLSQSGARIEDLIGAQLEAWRSLPAAPGGEVITVLAGSNDVLSPAHRRRLPQAVSELLSLLPADAIISAIPSPAPAAQQANALIAEAAGAGRIRAVFPDALGPSAWRGRLSADRFHPNDAGYEMIADVFADALSTAVRAAAGSHSGV